MTSRFRSGRLGGPIGYRAGAGGTVTQATSKSTAVTLNTLAGQITMNNAALAAAAEVEFTVNNNLVEAGDVPVIALASKAAADAGDYYAVVTAVAAGSFNILLGNTGADSESDAVVINFVIIKGATA